MQIRGARVTFGDMRIFEHWNLTNEPAMLIGMVVGYLCADSGGAPGTVIDSLSITCSTLSTNRTRISFNLPLNTLNAPATTLWLQVYAGYPTSGVDYVRVFTDPTNTYTFGVTKAYNGSAWSAVTPVEKMWFENLNKDI